MKRMFKSSLALVIVLTMLVCSINVFAATSDIDSSHVEFVGEASSLSARALVYSPMGEAAQLILAVYDSDGALVDAKSASGANAVLTAGPVDATGNTVKAFVWADDTKEVISEIATFDEDFNALLDTLEITFDGADFESFVGEPFNKDVDTYSAELTGGIPEVKATIGNNGAEILINSEKVTDTTAKTTITVNYGERIVGSRTTSNDVTRETYTYPNTKTYTIDYTSVSEKTSIYVGDIASDTAVRGDGNYGRNGGMRTFGNKYAKDITVGPEGYKMVTVEAKNAADSTIGNGKALSQSFFITVNPTDPEKKGSVIGIPRNGDGEWIYTNGTDADVVAVTDSAKIPDERVRLSYDDQTGVSTYGEKSAQEFVKAEISSDAIATVINYENVYYGLTETDFNRCTGSAVYEDGHPTKGGMSMFEIPEGYEGVEQLTVGGYGGKSTSYEILRGDADNRKGASIKFTFYITADAEVALWTKDASSYNNNNATELEYAKIDGEEVTVETVEDKFVANYQNGLNIAPDSNNGYKIEYDNYINLLEAFLIHSGAVKGVDYIYDGNNFRIVNYSMPEGFDYVDNQGKFAGVFYLCLKEGGSIVDPSTDPRIAGKTAEEIAAIITDTPAAEAGISNLVTDLSWTTTTEKYGTGWNREPVLGKFDTVMTNGADSENLDNFAFFKDRSGNTKVGQLISYPGVFDIYGADVVRGNLDWVFGSEQPTADWTGRKAGNFEPAGSVLPWMQFKVNADARVMVFTTIAEGETIYYADLVPESETGWTAIELGENDYIKYNGNGQFTGLSIKEYAAGETVTIYSPNRGSSYSVMVVPVN